MVDLEGLEKLAERGGLIGYALYRAGKSFFRRMRRNEKVTGLDIGGTAPELRLNARVADVERQLKVLTDKGDERHDQNLGNFERVFQSLDEMNKTVGTIARKLINRNDT